MLICAVAIQAATYAIDQLYDYIVPESLTQLVQIGCRVLVPFGRGNKKVEGMILAIRTHTSGTFQLKPLTQLLDEQPVLDEAQIHLAIWMRERLYCTFFDCLHAMLPAGLWFKKKEVYCLSGLPIPDTLSDQAREVLALFSNDTPQRTIEELRTLTHGRCTGIVLAELEQAGCLSYHSNIRQRSQHKTERMLSLAIPTSDAMDKIVRARTSVQQDVITLLADGSSMSQQEVSYMTGASDSVLRSMIRKGILSLSYVERFRFPDYSMIEKIEPPILNAEQSIVYKGLCTLLNEHTSRAALLFGVTGSGKTQIYAQLIADTLDSGRSAILLVPEIGLTPQLVRLFVGRFGETVAVMHSALSAGERYDNWKQIRSGCKRVVIGTRSAIFSPVCDLGLIILDEEHDSAYKSEQSPRYHARDVAKKRVQQSHALLILGSATPSVETNFGAEQGKYPVFHLSERYHGVSLPQVIIADRRGEIREGWNGMIGRKLHQAIANVLERKEQAILFLNRRGNSRIVGCSICGWIPECPSCSTTMTYHSVNNRAICHICGASIRLSTLCPVCHAPHLFMEGAGTQKVEQELHEQFPQARVLRMDADTTNRKNSHEKMLETFSHGGADILLGTQMVTKGLDFDHVTLVGVLDADQSLFSQDYRAHERTFSLITQVIGRAGRRDQRGIAIIQTYHPEHPVLLCAARQDYLQFYQSEIENRIALRMPPAEQLFMLTACGEQESMVIQTMMRLKQRIMNLMHGQFSDFQYPVLGPAPATIVRVMGKYRYHLLIRCPDNKRRRQLMSGVMMEFYKDKQVRGISLMADLNPDTL